MKITAGKKELQQCPSSTPFNPFQSSDLLEKPSKSSKPHRRKSRGSGNGVRLRKDSGGKRSSRPETPLLRWKFDEVGVEDENEFCKQEKSPPEAGRNNGRKVRAVVSARKLAAGIWRMQLPGVSPGGGEKLGFQVGFCKRSCL